MSFSRFSKELQELDETKLPRDPTSTGRFSPLGVFTTLLETVFPWALSVALPLLVVQWMYCIQPTTSDPDVMCDSSYMAPWWVWCFLVLEAAFHVAMKIKLAYLQSFDSQEAYFKASNIMSLEERQLLWDRVLKAESHNIQAYFEDWFLGTPFEDISTHELQNMVGWGFFDGRNQEHLSEEECQQLDQFVNEALDRIEKLNATITIEIVNKKPAMRNSESLATSADDDISVEGLPPPCNERFAEKLRRELEINQHLLRQTLAQAGDTPGAEMSQVMRKITQCYHRLQRKGLVVPELDSPSWKQCQRYARPTADPLLGVRFFPLFIHILVFVTTQLPAPFLLGAAGFRLHRSGPVTYYFHPGRRTGKNVIPLVFIHGIGVGPLTYLPLILQMMTTGRPIFLPVVQSVSAFRPWVFPNDSLIPNQISTCMSMMLASHGFAKATFSAHSFGTFWMTYMVKYAPSFVAGLVFLDPVNFCLYNSLLTRRVVYNQPDPGDMGHMIRTDMMVNWSIQRNFSWVRGNLFMEDIGDKPCTVFLSSDDKVAPSTIQEAYLKKHGKCSVKDADQVKTKDFESGNSVVIFRGCDHGLWMLNPFQNLPKVVESLEATTRRVEVMEEARKNN